MNAAVPRKRAGRSPNRRQSIIAAASDLFATQGFDQVSIADIAAAVGVVPSALYRHFPGKDEILVAALHELAEMMEEEIAASGPGAVFPSLSCMALNYRHVGTMWQREARHLPSNKLEFVRSRILSLQARLAKECSSDSFAGQYAAGAALAVIFSPSFQYFSLPRPRYEELLAQLAERAGTASLRPDQQAGTATALQPAVDRSSRREAIFNSAMTLFALDSYSAVGIDDIALACSVAPSTIYNHFQSKQEILTTAVQRNEAYLQCALNELFANSRDAESALQSIAVMYTRYCLEHTNMMTVVFSEIHNVPADELPNYHRSHQEFVNEWATLLVALNSDLDVSAASVTAQAAITAINVSARTSKSTRLSKDDSEAMILSIVFAILGVSNASKDPAYATH